MLSYLQKMQKCIAMFRHLFGSNTKHDAIREMLEELKLKWARKHILNSQQEDTIENEDK